MGDNKAIRNELDPDPLSIVLAVLGAVGSVASIAGYIEQQRDKRRWSRYRDERKRAQLIEKVSEIEAALTEIEGQIEKLQIIISLARIAANSQQIDRAPLRFGSVKLILTDDLYKQFAQLHIKTNSLCSKVLRSTYASIKLIYDLGIDISPQVYEKLLTLQSDLNSALIGEMSVGQAIALNLKVVDAARVTIQKLRDDFDIEPEPRNDFGPSM